MVRIHPGADFVDDFDVIVEDGRDDRDHIGFNDSGSNVLRPTHTDVDDALEGEAPFPHLHQVLAPALLENAYQSFNAAIDGQDISNSSR